MTTVQGKRYREATAAFDHAEEHTPAEAIGIVRSLPGAKFDETVEVSFRLGIDTRKQDQTLRGTVTLPNGSGRTVRVAVFAQGDKGREARDAGAPPPSAPLGFVGSIRMPGPIVVETTSEWMYRPFAEDGFALRSSSTTVR